MSISGTVKAIQDIMRQDAGVDGDAQRISQLAWMFFLKIFDDQEQERRATFELEGKDYTSPIPEALSWSNWASDPEGMTGDELLNFINNELFPILKDLDVSEGDKRRFVVREAFSDAYNYMKSGTLLRQVVNKISSIDFTRREDQHLFGDIYEQILRDLQSAGNAGEFYTPRAVTQFMVDMIDPRLGEIVLDPACGTGGFLTHTIDHLNDKYVKSASDWDLLQATVRGVEKKQLPHLLATTNLMLHGIDVPSQVRHDNTLNRPYASYGPSDRVDVVLTNPPFGGTEEEGIENNFPSTLRTRETADLFIALILRVLKSDGRAAVVLPDGFLFGEGVKTRLKEQLLVECNLHTIVRLPRGVFAPYTPIKTNLLFFEKGATTDEVWFFEHPYPDGYKSYGKTKPIQIEEFDREKAWWEAREETEYAWRVPIDEIRERGYNLDISNPNTPQERPGDPQELLTEFKRFEAKANEFRCTLKSELAAALLNARQGDVKPRLLIDHFDDLLEADNGPAQIRRLVFDLAITGRITEQSPTNEDAQRCLDETSDLKRRLIKEQALKRTKILPPVSSEDEPFALPENWAWTRLSNLGVVNPRNHAEDAADAAFVPMAAIPEVYGRQVSVETRPWKEIRKGYTHFAENDVAVAKITPCFQNGKAAVMRGLPNGIGAGTTELYVFRPINDCILPEYVLAYFKSPYFVEAAIPMMSGTAGQQRVPKKHVQEHPFPFPPYAEQLRIVAAVDRLLDLCDKLEHTMRQRDTARHRLMTVLSRL